jgi:hypothetical protein
MVVKRRVREACDGLGDALAGRLNGNVVILLEVETGLLLGGVVGYTEELTLDAGVGGARNVLAIFPLAVAGTARRATTTSTTGLAICSSVELAGRTAPSAAALGTVTTARSESLCIGVGPVASTAVHLLPWRRTIEASTI